MLRLAVWFCFLINICAIKKVQGCGDIISCDECISSPLVCKWCSDTAFTESRCVPKNEILTCTDIVNPEFSESVTQNVPLGTTSTIQIQPQFINANMRVGEPQTFDFEMELAPNFPLDVYFLMDFSFSMEEHLTRLRADTLRIVNSISENITSNFTVGFGSFVDKPTTPYTLTGNTGQNIGGPCVRTNTAGQCLDTYAFRNHLSLTNDSSAFQMAVNNANVSVNLDRPEGSLDAMAQVISCSEDIGWRPAPVRHLLVLITDNTFHYASDGKLGGNVRTNDGSCKLSLDADTGLLTYNATEALAIDYPSIGLVGELLVEKQIIPLFMVITSASDIQQQYQNLIDTWTANNGPQILQLSQVESLSDVSQLIETIGRIYRNISTLVSFSSPKMDGVDVSISLDCLTGGADQGEQSHQCRNVVVGQRIPIKVEVNITECTDNVRDGLMLRIQDQWTGSTTLNISVFCTCDCSALAPPYFNDSMCSGNGRKVCGACECDSEWFGETCKCSKALLGVTNPTGMCPLGVNGEVCSGQGTCECGKCECNPGYNNSVLMACDCSNIDCPRRGGMLCNGQGTCECNKCTCMNGYRGDGCDCPPINVCIPEGSTLLCNGKGTCPCTACECDEGFGGSFCELCTSTQTCTSDDCKPYTDCLECQYRIDGASLSRIPNAPEVCRNVCQSINVREVNTEADISEDSSFQCPPVTLSGICDVEIHFNLDQARDQILYVERSLDGCFQFPPWAILLIILVALLIIGILILLLIKLILFILDYREYKRFQKEVAGTQFGQNINPLYHQPETKHQNPLFAGNKEKTPPTQEPEVIKKPL